MGIAAAGTAGDTRVSGELMLQATNVGALRCKFNRVLCALHLVNPHLCFAHGDLSWIVRQLIDVKKCALHLL